MGIQTMGLQLNSQQSHLQPASLTRQNSWYSLTLDEIKNQLGEMRKPVGSMNFDEFLHNIWIAEANQSMGGMESESSSSVYSLQRQASFTLARALSGKTVDDVWREIQQGQQKKKNHEDLRSLGDMTLENFLIQAGIYAEASPSPIMGLLDAIDTMAEQNFSQKMCLLSSSSSTPTLGAPLDTSTLKWRRDPSDTFEKTMAEQTFSQKMCLLSSSSPPTLGASLDTSTPKWERDPSDTFEKTMAEQNFSQKMCLLSSSSSPSLDAPLDTSTPKRRRDPSDTFEKTRERRLKRKIKNRESAARSRARKQAYHDELVNKVSRLEEKNLKLKKEKEFENAMQSEPISEPKYRLRRTSSASF